MAEEIVHEANKCDIIRNVETMNIWMWVYVCGFVYTSVQVTGWFFAQSQDNFPTLSCEWREDLGANIFFGLLYGAIWPVGLWAAWLITGFAEHGWRIKHICPYGTCKR